MAGKRGGATIPVKYQTDEQKRKSKGKAHMFTWSQMTAAQRAHYKGK